MPAPTPSPDRMTAAELRAAFRSLQEQVDAVHDEIQAVREGLAVAGQQVAVPAVGTRDFDAVEIVLSYDDKGEPTYKVKGLPFMKFGVRLWPETLPELGIDPATLKPGPNKFNARVRALMGDKGPRKIVGLVAPAQADDRP